jgi:hypothetical protein
VKPPSDTLLPLFNMFHLAPSPSSLQFTNETTQKLNKCENEYVLKISMNEISSTETAQKLNKCENEYVLKISMNSTTF